MGSTSKGHVPHRLQRQRTQTAAASAASTVAQSSSREQQFCANFHAAQQATTAGRPGSPGSAAAPKGLERQRAGVREPPVLQRDGHDLPLQDLPRRHARRILLRPGPGSCTLSVTKGLMAPVLRHDQQNLATASLPRHSARHCSSALLVPKPTSEACYGTQCPNQNRTVDIFMACWACSAQAPAWGLRTHPSLRRGPSPASTGRHAAESQHAIDLPELSSLPCMSCGFP